MQIYGKLIDGEPEVLKSFIRVNGTDIFTTDETIIIGNGYKPIIYSEPETREGFYASSFVWAETDTEIIQEWQYTEITESDV